MNTTNTISDNQIQKMVSYVNPYWNVKQINRGFHSSSFVAEIIIEEKFQDQITVFLKANNTGTVSEELARTEPRFLQILNDKKSIPTPSIMEYCDYHSEHPTPYYITEKISGINGNEYNFSKTDKEDFIDTGISHLSQIHNLHNFDSYGYAGVKDPSKGIEVMNTKKHKQSDSFKSWIGDYVENKLNLLSQDEQLSDRFSDLKGVLESKWNDIMDDFDLYSENSTYVHWDYRPGNTLINSDTGQVNAVLDFSSLYITDPVFNIAKFESHLIRPFRDKSSTISYDILDAYGRERDSWDITQDQMNKMNACRFVCLIDKLASFDIRYSDLSEANKQRKEDEYRYACDTMLDTVTSEL